MRLAYHLRFAYCNVLLGYPMNCDTKNKRSDMECAI
jgi:hypothetical protein